MEGRPLTTEMVRHFDLCLGCLACVTACPSGEYEKLIEATRQQVERRHPRTAAEKYFRHLIFALFPHRSGCARDGPLALYARYSVGERLRRSGLTARLPARLRAMEELTPDLPRGERSAGAPEFTPARGVRRARVGLLTGCVQSVFFPYVNAATARVLSADGCDVVAPPGQGCCGALRSLGTRAEAQTARRRSSRSTGGVERWP
ncbi:MAG: heterodisulfide reductase-related iron-sulfur binding cluster [Chloroflexia bacterium]